MTALGAVIQHYPTEIAFSVLIAAAAIALCFRMPATAFFLFGIIDVAIGLWIIFGTMHAASSMPGDSTGIAKAISNTLMGWGIGLSAGGLASVALSGAIVSLRPHRTEPAVLSTRREPHLSA